ncbi:hypothetical protein L596_010751 [Steinernema carpocapsae]|uniref:Uncharacterized protein n=1 Tax=Steinernema carpocapsae TaxID=34508 RepID=A0A4U5PJG3_STECR|nr:hypothetical protein L596_010751 [Steinernema carpocapsae]
MPAAAVNPENVAVDDAPVEQPNATMETKVTGQGQPKRVGRWSLAQLRQTDGIIPSQAGWNKGDSQKLMTNFGTPRTPPLASSLRTCRKSLKTSPSAQMEKSAFSPERTSSPPSVEWSTSVLAVMSAVRASPSTSFPLTCSSSTNSNSKVSC